MCDIVFEKAKDRGGKVNRRNVYAEVAARRVLIKCIMRNFAEFTKKYVPESLF